MASKIRVFLDSSVIFAGILSSEGGSRLLLKLGEARAIQLLVSPQVLREMEAVIRKKSPQNLGNFTILLDRADITITKEPKPESVNRCQSLVPHAGDAVVLASAWENQIDYFVSLDKKHFLDNLDLREKATFPIGSPGDFLAWFRAKY